MKASHQLFFWGGALALLAIFILLFQAVLTPFVTGIVIAYLLNPVVEKLQSLKLSRLLATVLILLIFFTVALLALFLIVPPLYQELVELADSIPGYVNELWRRLQPVIGFAADGLDAENIDGGLLQILRDNFSNALSVSANVVAALIGGGRAVAGLVSMLVVTPLVSFFVLLEWKSLVQWVDDLLPRNSYEQVTGLLSEIDRKIAAFIRGQLLVALSLSVIYGLAMTAMGLEFGFLIGLTAGFLSIIPVFGSIVGLVLGSMVAWFQSSDISYVGIIAGIFIAGQVVESNFITPKLLGGSVGLHPLWIIFSLMAGSALFGVVGMMLAVPVAASVGVLARFALDSYKDSKYYEA